MKIPKRIKIGGHWVDIILEDDVIRDGDRKLLGKADYNHKKIYLALNEGGRRLKKSALGDVFLHELIHFVDSNASAGLDEKQIEQISIDLYAVLHNNKLRF